MIIIELPSMMMSRMIQYNLVIQSPNCSCQEVSEYPLQRLVASSFTQCYKIMYLPTTLADAYLQIQGMAQWLDVYLSIYLAQYIKCMTFDSEFIAFINHAIQLALDLTTYSNIWAVLSILLETQDVNASYMQTMHDYYNQCYDPRS